MAETTGTEFEAVIYEQPSERIVRIVLNRPDKANAQNLQMLYDLNTALDKAAADNDVRVIIIAAAGKHFSSGHGPMGGSDDYSLQDVAISTSRGFGQPGIEGHWAFEEEVFFGLCWRWRNIPKPTIAEVQGKVIAGGLMLVWPFDLVVASEDATFQDPVVAFGVNGVEYFGHRTRDHGQDGQGNRHGESRGSTCAPGGRNDGDGRGNSQTADDGFEDGEGIRQSDAE